MSKRILCVHEDDETCKTLTEPLARLGHEVTNTPSIARALYVAATQHFDLFIIDRFNLDRVGLDVCRKIRQMNPQTPILIYTGAARGVEPGDVDAVGAAYFFPKPNLKELVSHVKKLV